jgi:hypothetical protein
MQGTTHVATGGLTAAALAPYLGLHTFVTVLPFMAITAGYALVPDLDHPGAAASRIGGPVTGWLCDGLCALSAWTFRLTKTPKDVPSAGTHRHLTHIIAFALVLGGAAHLTAVLWGAWAVVGWLVAGLALAVDRLGAIALVAYLASLASWAPSINPHSAHLGRDVLAALDHTSPWLGIAVGLGCLTHDLGDALTTAGVPLLAPLKLTGQRWRRLHLLPQRLRFHTGSDAEHWVLVLTAIGTVLELPGVFRVVVHAVVAFTRAK